MAQQPLHHRFWKNVHKTDTCWNWIGAIQKGGYGTIELNYHSLKAHRVSYEIHFGQIPKGRFVCHHCDNRRCVNPNHLFLGNPSINGADAASKDRMPFGNRHIWSKLKESNIPFIRSALRFKTATGPELARKFGVHHTVIYHAARGITWKRAGGIPLAR